MNKETSLIKYAIIYLSKFSSSKKNLEKILKNKIGRMKVEKKDKFVLYNSIPEIILKLENNKLIDDKNYSLSKIRSLAIQGRSKLFVKSYLVQKGIKEIIILNTIEEFEHQNPGWEKESAKIFARKKNLSKDPENKEKNLNKMARAGFTYELCKNTLKID